MHSKNIIYDIIGDIHGHADELKALLSKLGYQISSKGIYFHKERKAIFLGDLIDRGKQNREVLGIVKNMVDNNFALAIMGNHEYNAICFHKNISENGTPKYLREHSKNNIFQHKEVLSEFVGKEDELKIYLEWFMTLPVFIEMNGIRLVHACWSAEDIKFIKKVLVDGKLTEEFLLATADKSSKEYDAIENILKGIELKLPEGVEFQDHEGICRKEIRIKWWENPINKTYKEYTVGNTSNIPDKIISNEIIKNIIDNTFYTSEKPLIFFGHYWFSGIPERITNNIACLDYSVAKKNGKLAAYQWMQEKEIDNNNFVFVDKN